MEKEERLLLPTEVSEILRVPRAYVYKLSRSGELQTVRVGRHLRFRVSAVENYIHSRSTDLKGID
jgi:excisionase family DNA binding protein